MGKTNTVPDLMCVSHSAVSTLGPHGLSMGTLQARILEWVAVPFSWGIFLTQGLNQDLLHCKKILYHMSY